MIERVWQVLKILFRIYQYTCYSFLFLLLSPVLALYVFDVTLYLFRLMVYFIRFQVYLIRNRCLPDSRIIHRTGGSYSWKLQEKEAEEESASSNTSILSAFRDSKESLLDDTGSISSNYSLVSSSKITTRRHSSSRNGSIFAIDPAQMSILTASAEMSKLRRSKNSDVELSLDRYEIQRIRTETM